MVVTDNFNRANANDLGPNWLANAGSIHINANALLGQPGAGISTWQSNLFNPAQYSEITVISAVPIIVGLAVRNTGVGAAWTEYLLEISSTTCHITRVINNSASFLATFLQVIGAGDRLRLEITGSTIRAFVNTVQIGTDVIDSTHATGAPGVYLGNADTMDDWEGGELATTPYLPKT